MNTVVENMTGTNVMTDQVIALDLLNTAKTGIKKLAIAITETASPEVRTVLRKQLEDAISIHERLVSHMIDKGWYKPYDVPAQLKLVLGNADTALKNVQS